MVVTVEIVVPDEVAEGPAEAVVLNMLDEVKAAYAIGSWQVVAIEDDYSDEAKSFGADVNDHV